MEKLRLQARSEVKENEIYSQSKYWIKQSELEKLQRRARQAPSNNLPRIETRAPEPPSPRKRTHQRSIYRPRLQRHRPELKCIIPRGGIDLSIKQALQPPGRKKTREPKVLPRERTFSILHSCGDREDRESLMSWEDE